LQRWHLARRRPRRRAPRAEFEPLSDPTFFAQVRVDEDLGTITWPNGADLDPLVLHGDFEPASGRIHH
jgi:hypothetical protein